MGVSGTNNHMYSQQISQQAQAQFSQLRSKNTGLLSRDAIQQMKNSDIYSQYRQMRTQENSAINLQSLSETVAQYQQMGFNVDTNSLAAMYDSNGDGLLSGTELKQAERGLNSMYQNYMSQIPDFNKRTGQQAAELHKSARLRQISAQRFRALPEG